MSGTEPYDPTRAASVGSAELSEDRINHAVLAQKAMLVFRKGVVVEVLGDVTTRDDDFFKQFDPEEDPDDDTLEFRNDLDLEKAPRNSLIIRDVTNGAGRSDSRHIVCFPFFSSHVMLPVKPGETVWFTFLSPSEEGSRAYWLSRICDVDFVEDTNFSHHDRRHDDVIPDPDGDPRIVASLHNGADPTKIDPTAPDEEGDDETLRTFKDPEAFSKIRGDSLESSRFVIEPVPRLTKMPGDLVLQGSNNTAIVLGTDRGFGLENRPDGKKSVLNSEDKLEALRGSIDLVTGRGRFFTVDEFDTYADDKLPPDLTRPRVTKNAEEDYETDKNTANDADAGGDEEKGARVNLEADPNEGDPDFINDASRIYVSMQTDVDANFGTTIENIPEAYDKDASKSTLQNSEKAAAIALKSDEIRIIARNTGMTSLLTDAELSDAGAAEINGSIRIIKEGTPGKVDGKEGDAASIYLLPDGTIQITGKKIMIGKSAERDEGTALHEQGKGIDDEELGKTEPYMRYTEFNLWANGLIDAINSAFEATNKAINDNGSAMDMCGNQGSSGGITPGFGAPNGLIGAALGALIAVPGASFDGQPDRDAIDEFKDTSKIKSKRIFGE